VVGVATAGLAAVGVVAGVMVVGVVAGIVVGRVGGVVTEPRDARACPLGTGGTVGAIAAGDSVEVADVSVGT
jgi:hypothetical protein